MVKRRVAQVETQIDLERLLRLCWKRWRFIVLMGVLAAMATLVCTWCFVTPMYQASVTIYVSSVPAGQQLDAVNSSSLSTAQKLVKTYVNIIRSDTVLETVAERVEAGSGQRYSPEELRREMSAAQVDETEMFNVYIEDADPEMAAMIANAVAEEAPAQIEKFVEGSSTKVVDFAKTPSTPCSPSLLYYTVVGGAVGVVAALAWLTLGFLLDVRVTDEQELEQMLGLPILCRVPSFSQADRLQTDDPEG